MILPQLPEGIGPTNIGFETLIKTYEDINF